MCSSIVYRKAFLKPHLRALKVGIAVYCKEGCLTISLSKKRKKVVVPFIMP